MKSLENGVLYLSREDVLEYIKNRPPLLMIEEAYVIPGECAYSEMILKDDAWYFKCHFPGNPMMPGVLQLESIFNTAALPIKLLEGNKYKTTNIAEVKKVHYRKHIRPGDKIRIDVKINKNRRGLSFMDGRIKAGDEICCEAEFVLVILDDILNVEQ
ncbi:MAG: hypothetical protein IJI65_07015 [Lachnospiraceae bacterium]|nr:hypothetical protein [Lachnospiraceae bacterium]